MNKKNEKIYKSQIIKSMGPTIMFSFDNFLQKKMKKIYKSQIIISVENI